MLPPRTLAHPVDSFRKALCWLASTHCGWVNTSCTHLSRQRCHSHQNVGVNAQAATHSGKCCGVASSHVSNVGNVEAHTGGHLCHFRHLHQLARRPSQLRRGWLSRGSRREVCVRARVCVCL